MKLWLSSSLRQGRKASLRPKKKISLAFKASIKNKPSSKTKPSAKLKSLKKKHEKQTSAKALVKAGSKQDLSEKPPVPPPEQAPPAEIEFDDPLLNQEVVIVSEAAGRLSFGKHGKLTHGSTPATYICVTDSGAYQVEPEWVEIKTSKAKVLKVKWPKWTQLSKRDLSLMLSQLSCNPEDEVGLSPKEWSIHTVIPCPKEIPEMEDQHLWLGWALLRWCFDKANVALPEVLGVHCVDPILSKLILENDGNPAQLEGFKEGIKKSWPQHCKLLLVPVHSQLHWTLLAAQRAGPGQPITWRRYDSLSKEHEESHPQQIFMGQLLDLSNIATQPVGSNACGCYVLHYMEEGLRLFRGEWPSVWPEDGWKDWKLRLVTIVPKLLAHANAFIEDGKIRHAKLESQMAGIAQQKSKAEKKLSKLTDITSAAYQTAKDQLDKNSVRFTWKNLSQDSVHKVKRSKCRWQSGCLSCDAYKCLRYHLHSEAAKAHMLPYLSTGPEDLEQLLKSGTLAISASSSSAPISSSSAAPTS